MMDDYFDLIIVGGGPSSRILNKYLHLAKPEIRTLVIRDEERIVNHCGTPYIMEGEIPWEKGLISEQLVLKFDTPILVDPVIGGDAGRHLIHLASGKTLEYGRLVLATGTDQVLPPIPGIDLENVFKIRRTEDLRRSMKLLENLHHITILGAGYIGLEFALALKKMGKDVRIIEMAEHIMGGRIDREMANRITAHLEKVGIQIICDRAATRISGAGSVDGVEISDGRVLETEGVLSAVGVRPMTEPAAAMGLEYERDGIIVDEFFQTSAEDIYAIGDCIRTHSSVTGSVVSGKLGSNAGQMARRLALNLSGRPRPFPGVINAAVTRLGKIAYGAAGLSERDARTEGIEVVIGRNTSSTIYENMPGTSTVDIKIIYRKDDLVLIGGEIVGDFNPAGFVETLAQLIERKSTLEDVLTMSYSSHPELTPKTSKPYWVWASEALYRKTIQKSS